MNVTPTELDGGLLIEPTVRGDSRGYFLESWQGERYERAGGRGPFVQDNVSRSMHGVLRGLHFQHPRGQAKLVSVTYGEVFDVVADVRRGSPTFGRWVGYTLSDRNHRQLYIPEGFAHGFVVTGPEAVFTYKVSAHYDAGGDWAIAWDDPDIGVTWPTLAERIISERDRLAPRLRDVPPERLPVYAPPGA